jgi:multiple sugar transport system permease protein
MLRIYIEGILFNRMGSASAMSIFVAAILLIVTTLNFRVFGRSDQD